MSDQDPVTGKETGEFAELATMFEEPEPGASIGRPRLSGARTGAGVDSKPTRDRKVNPTAPLPETPIRKRTAGTTTTAGKSPGQQGVVYQPTVAELEADPDLDCKTCGALLGAKQDKFCTLAGGDCDIMSHKTADKFAIRPGSIHIQSGKSRAYCDPELMVEDLKPRETITDLLAKQKPVIGWVDLFARRSSGQHDIDSEGSSVSEREEDEMDEDEVKELQQWVVSLRPGQNILPGMKMSKQRKRRKKRRRKGKTPKAQTWPRYLRD